MRDEVVLVGRTEPKLFYPSKSNFEVDETRKVWFRAKDLLAHVQLKLFPEQCVQIWGLFISPNSTALIENIKFEVRFYKKFDVRNNLDLNYH